MTTPTKKMACEILESYIEYWFQSGIAAEDRGGRLDSVMSVCEFIDEEPHLYDIAERHNIIIHGI